ncbi:MAG: hypothetical protein GF384_01385, partial [Elusimicrobia bacterium]|nr:hypothetical protein [Elusimicrobiota bacterium]MBD3411676.1 hypothetical protein [Elusimicrobiota bacterium]
MNIFYAVNILLIPVVVFAGYVVPVRYLFYAVSALGGGYLLMALADPHGIWLYGGMCIAMGSAAYVTFVKAQEYHDLVRLFEQKIHDLKAHYRAHTHSATSLKTQIAAQEKDIQHSIYMYSIIKGLAETINWDSMVPIIGRAVN